MTCRAERMRLHAVLSLTSAGCVATAAERARACWRTNRRRSTVERNADHADEHERQVAPVLGLPDEAPRPVCAATISAESTHDQAMASVTLRPARMPGSAPGQNDLAHDREVVGAKVARGPDQQRIDLFGALERGEQDVEPRAHEDDCDLLRLADAEPQHGQRNPGDRGQRPQQRHERIDNGFRRPPHAHQDAERDGDQSCQREPRKHTLRRHEDRRPKLAAAA